MDDRCNPYAPTLEWVPLESDLISAAAYDGQNLYVHFEQSGRRFMYANVPRHHFQRLLTSPLPGKYFKKNIKKYYEAETF